MTKGQIEQLAIKALEDQKAQDLTVISLAGKADFADSMIIASGTSSRHIQALAARVQEVMQEHDQPRGTVEGSGATDWVLLDLGSVIVHLFLPQARAYYDLEQLWGGVRPGGLA